MVLVSALSAAYEPAHNMDTSCATIGQKTKNTQKPKFFEKRKKSSKTQKLKNV